MLNRCQWLLVSSYFASRALILPHTDVKYVFKDTLAGASRFGNKYGIDLKLEDSLAAALTDRVPVVTPMGVTAENLADKFNITRADSDNYAIQSQQRWKAGKYFIFFFDFLVKKD